MLVFHGGLSIEQVQLLYENKYTIFKMIPTKWINIPNKNTFDYYDINKEFHSEIEFWESIRNDIFYNQYFFFFKYLKNALTFCHNTTKRNYILVADIDEDVLEKYIGCGRYIDNSIEYRVPRKIIKLDTIKDILYYEPYEDYSKLREKYPHNFYSDAEKEEAEMIMNQKKLVFNEYKKHPKF